MSASNAQRVGRILFLSVTLMAIVMFFQSYAMAATCQLNSELIGSVTGHGRNREKALENAINMCFEKRVAQLQPRRTANSLVNSDAGETAIDDCINLTCAN